MKKDLIAHLELGTGMVIAGSSIVVGKAVVSTFPVFLASGMRFGLGSTVLIALVIWREGGFPKMSLVDLAILSLQTLTGTFLFSIFLLFGLQFTSASDGGIVTSTTPAIVGVISFIALRERFSWYKATGIALAVVAILAVSVGAHAVGGGGSNPLLGNLLVFGAAICEALFTVLRKAVTGRVSPLANATTVNVLAFLMFLPLAAAEALQFDFVVLTARQWVPVVYYGTVVTVGGFFLLFQGVSKLPVSTSAVFSGIMPVSAVILSVLFLREPFLASHAIGAACVVAGIVLIAGARQRASRPVSKVDWHAAEG